MQVSLPYSVKSIKAPAGTKIVKILQAGKEN